MHKMLLEMYKLLMDVEIPKSWPPISQVKHYQHNPIHNEKKKSFHRRKSSANVWKPIGFTKEYPKEPGAEFRCLKIWQSPN